MRTQTLPCCRALLAASFALAIAQGANAQLPQISEGVRAMMAQAAGGYKDGSRYMVARQPPIYEYMPAEPGIRTLSGDGDLLRFFEEFPSKLQSRGLWITRAIPPNGETEQDRQLLSRLVAEAARRNIVLYACDAAMSSDPWLVGWQCKKKSPKSSDALIECVPRPKPDQFGHPAWDCATQATR
jgi:hypothetical protein